MEGLDFYLGEKENLYSLTDIWRASGRSKNKHPYVWIRSDGASYIEYVTKSERAQVLMVSKGRGGGTYGHWRLIVAYAKYLSQRVYVQVREAFSDMAEEETQIIEVEPQNNYDVDRELSALKYAIDILRPSESLKIKMVDVCLNELNCQVARKAIPTAFILGRHS